MAKKEDNSRIKSKTIEVKSKALFGKTEMDKAIEKYTNQGWELHKKTKVRNKDRYTLQFVYIMSDEEVAAENRRKRNRNLIIGGLMFLCCGFSYFQGQLATRQQAVEETATAEIVRTRRAYATQTATLWTPTYTFTPSLTPTLTLTPTITNTPTVTLTPTITNTPTLTFTPSITPSATITDTPRPTNTECPSNTPRPTAINTTTYYIDGSSANVRDCPQTTCQVVTAFNFGEDIEVTDNNVDGQNVSGSSRWYEILHNGQLLYVHSSLISRTVPPTPRPASVQSSGSSGSNSSSTTNQSQPAAQQSQWNCSGDIYNCPSFSSCSEMFSYWNTCPGDPSNLDGDNDGRPCQSQCG